MFDDHEISQVKAMLARGDKQQDIAAFFGVNQARVNDVKKGKVGASVKPCKGLFVPAPGPYLSGRAADFAKRSLLQARDSIDAALDMLENIDKKKT